jgi:peptide-methionine (S)-S-oxide reductase
MIRRSPVRAAGPRRFGRAVAGFALVAALLAAVLLAVGPVDAADGAQPAPSAAAGARAATAVATFAAGCFWCVERDFDKVPGVISTTNGYTGGHTDNPDYDSVATGDTGHVEAMQVVYDPARVSYETLLAAFWQTVDPIDDRGQFCDRGPQYRPAIFAHSPEQRRLAEASIAAMQASGLFKRRIAVKVSDASKFTPAEPEHQDYHKRNPIRYMIYRFGCGRDQRLQQIWGRRAAG